MSLLLEPEDIDVNISGEYGQTSLSTAACLRGVGFHNHPPDSPQYHAAVEGGKQLACVQYLLPERYT